MPGIGPALRQARCQQAGAYRQRPQSRQRRRDRLGKAVFQEAEPLIGIQQTKWKRDKPDDSLRRRLPICLNGSSRRRTGSPGPCYRGKKSIPLFRDRLNIGAGGPGALQYLAQQRDLIGQADLSDEAVGPQRRHQSFLPHQVAGVAHQQQQSLEGLMGKGQNLVAAAQDAFGGLQPERAEDISLGLRRPVRGFRACSRGDSTRRTRRCP